MRVGHVAARLAVLASCACVGTCANAVVRPSLSPSTPAADALLVLPGFGYSRAGEKALRSLAPSMAIDGVEIFVPTYISRAGLDESRANLQRFIRARRLDQYDRLHVFAFIAGGWTLNPLVELGGLPNLATVVYDRSPYQERAPRIADETLHFLTWLRYGSAVFDVARTPYAPLTAPTVKVGIVVETLPSPFITRRAQKARDYGPFHFECDSFMQRYDDCAYLEMSHDQVYVRFGIQLRLLCNLLDGMLAVEEGFTSATGEIYNDLPDRVADVLILVGAGYAVRDLPFGVTLGWAAAVLAVSTAYVRLLGGSLGVTQHFLGPMAKQHRMFTLTVVALLASAEALLDMPPRAIRIGLGVIVAGSVVTTIRRTRRIVGEMEGR